MRCRLAVDMSDRRLLGDRRLYRLVVPELCRRGKSRNADARSEPQMRAFLGPERPRRFGLAIQPGDLGRDRSIDRRGPLRAEASMLCLVLFVVALPAPSQACERSAHCCLEELGFDFEDPPESG
ncbi:hypothetical protein D9M70_519510 [compost metagenome]